MDQENTQKQMDLTVTSMIKGPPNEFCDMRPLKGFPMETPLAHQCGDLIEIKTSCPNPWFLWFLPPPIHCGCRGLCYLLFTIELSQVSLARLMEDRLTSQSFFSTCVCVCGEKW